MVSFCSFAVRLCSDFVLDVSFILSRAQDDWLGKLQGIVSTVGEQFKKYFADMNCQGEHTSPITRCALLLRASFRAVAIGCLSFVRIGPLWLFSHLLIALLFHCRRGEAWCPSGRRSVRALRHSNLRLVPVRTLIACLRSRDCNGRHGIPMKLLTAEAQSGGVSD